MAQHTPLVFECSSSSSLPSSSLYSASFPSSSGIQTSQIQPQTDTNSTPLSTVPSSSSSSSTCTVSPCAYPSPYPCPSPCLSPCVSVSPLLPVGWPAHIGYLDEIKWDRESRSRAFVLNGDDQITQLLELPNRRPSSMFRIGPSTIPHAGLGCFATVNIPVAFHLTNSGKLKNNLLMNYGGIGRVSAVSSVCLSGYIFALSERGSQVVEIDAEAMGNESRFINDPQCSNKPPNCGCFSFKVPRLNKVGSVRYEYHLGIVAIAPIEAGDELLLEYGDDYWQKRAGNEKADSDADSDTDIECYSSAILPVKQETKADMKNLRRKRKQSSRPQRYKHEKATATKRVYPGSLAALAVHNPAQWLPAAHASVNSNAAALTPAEYENARQETSSIRLLRWYCKKKSCKATGHLWVELTNYSVGYRALEKSLLPCDYCIHAYHDHMRMAMIKHHHARAHTFPLSAAAAAASPATVPPAAVLRHRGANTDTASATSPSTTAQKVAVAEYAYLSTSDDEIVVMDDVDEPSRDDAILCGLHAQPVRQLFQSQSTKISPSPLAAAARSPSLPSSCALPSACVVPELSANSHVDDMVAAHSADASALPLPQPARAASATSDSLPKLVLEESALHFDSKLRECEVFGLDFECDEIEKKTVNVSDDEKGCVALSGVDIDDADDPQQRFIRLTNTHWQTELAESTKKIWAERWQNDVIDLTNDADADTDNENDNDKEKESKKEKHKGTHCGEDIVGDAVHHHDAMQESK